MTIIVLTYPGVQECGTCHVSSSRWNRVPGTNLCKGCHSCLTVFPPAVGERPAAGAPSVDEAPTRGLSPAPTAADGRPHPGD
jgi:hypothetical protein